MDRRKAAIGYATFVIAKKFLKRSLRKKAAAIGSSVEAATALVPGVSAAQTGGKPWKLIGGIAGTLVLAGAGAAAWFLKGRGSEEA